MTPSNTHVSTNVVECRVMHIAHTTAKYFFRGHAAFWQSGRDVCTYMCMCHPLYTLSLMSSKTKKKETPKKKGVALAKYA